MTDALAPTLRFVAAALQRARRPWWVIGSAAVLLHGAPTTVADVDLLLHHNDAADLLWLWGVGAAQANDPVFQSATYARYHVAGLLRIEIMADLTVRGEPVVPRSRVRLSDVFAPDREELARILLQFGRPKDVARAALLSALPAL